MKFKKLTLKNYKMFNNASIVFNKNMTVIVGGGGTGKTVIFNILKNYRDNSKDYFVEIEGEPPKEELYGFIDELFLQDLGDTSELNETNEVLMKEIRGLSPQIIDVLKSGKTLNQIKSTFAGGERIMLGFAMLFALRKIKGISSPLVMDCVFGALDDDKCDLLLKRIFDLKEQVIILEREYRLSRYTPKIINID